MSTQTLSSDFQIPPPECDLSTADGRQEAGEHATFQFSRTLLLGITLLVLLLQGCAGTPPRNPLPEELADVSHIPGIPRARYWGDESPPYTAEIMSASDEHLRQRFPALYGKEITFLAISGGGDNGAFGAGLLNGWTASGERPEFSMVTGVSTGALIAPFAFLGPKYDNLIKEFYTTYSTDDLLKMRSTLKTIRSDAAMDTTLLREVIAKYMTEEVMQEIAREFRRGRFLLISSTNLDAERPVIWNLGKIADSGHPGALDVIRDAMLASASIPVGFPPVMFDVEAEGELYDEMHVDGGATRQSFLFSFGIDNKALIEKLDAKGQARAYVIRNAIVAPVWQTVDRKLLPIAGRSSASMIRTQGLYDFYREYLGALQYNIDFNLTYIPDDFDEEATEFFDPVYMTKLYEVGFEMGLANDHWFKAPPGIEPK